MTDPDSVSADYTLRPSELAATLALRVERRAGWRNRMTGFRQSCWISQKQGASSLRRFTQRKGMSWKDRILEIRDTFRTVPTLLF